MLNDFKTQMEQKIVKIRQQFDINALIKDIGRKQDRDKAKTQHTEHEQKIRQLDSNVLLIASDFEKVQKVISKMHGQVQ